MSVLNIHVPNFEENKELINDLYKYFVILVVFHVLMYFGTKADKKLKFGFAGDLFNSDFITVLSFILISVAFYYLVGQELITFL